MTANRFLLDQMLDADVAEAIRQAGFIVSQVAELGMARSADNDILAAAIARGEILITLDGHFGDWAVLPLDKHPGVIRVRVNPATTRNVLDVLLPFLDKQGTGEHKDTLTIVSARGVRRIRTGMP